MFITQGGSPVSLLYGEGVLHHFKLMTVSSCWLSHVPTSYLVSVLIDIAFPSAVWSKVVINRLGVNHKTRLVRRLIRAPFSPKKPELDYCRVCGLPPVPTPYLDGVLKKALPGCPLISTLVTYHKFIMTNSFTYWECNCKLVVYHLFPVGRASTTGK